MSRLRFFSLAAAVGLLAATQPAVAHDHKGKGTIVSAAASSPDHKTLVQAVNAAGLTSTLAGKGPFTVFAPTDAAFAKLPAGTVQTLLEPANRDQLRTVLTYHVVSGKVKAADLVGQINAGGGQASLTTVEGSPLTAILKEGKVVIRDEKGGEATVTTADLETGNGVVHVTDAVSIPG
ncbi:fasciclin domain-containing protein [Sphingomonas arenae]|uniref:fasciclin domain-containing protein n=1 Tax=Sphingomonas arenae TaxID=2812555 RepID=UPI00196866E1|nr:fasciclin domain-containing protein [Sphingomonas arenae]